MYNIKTIDDLKYITFSSLDKYDELFHCFTTRCGGLSEGVYASMNLGLSSGDDREVVMKNYEILSDKLGFKLHDMVKTHQTHTANIMYATEENKGNVFNRNPGYDDIDGLITDKKNIIISTSHADCTPLYFYDPVRKVIGVAHAGWRGTVSGIAGNMIDKFINDFESSPEDIVVVIGPSLEQSCFEVDEDVAEIFLNTNEAYINFMYSEGKKSYINLWEINRYILLGRGLKEENIEISELCTKCNPDLFFSHRGQQGKRGTMLGIMMMK